MNELKSDIHIADDVIMKFKQFWSDFKDTPLKGRNLFSLYQIPLLLDLSL